MWVVTIVTPTVESMSLFKPQRSCLRLRGGGGQSARLEQSFTQVVLDSGVKSFERDEHILTCWFMTEFLSSQRYFHQNQGWCSLYWKEKVKRWKPHPNSYLYMFAVNSVELCWLELKIEILCRLITYFSQAIIFWLKASDFVFSSYRSKAYHHF